MKDPSHIWQYKLIKIPDKPSPSVQQKDFPLTLCGLTRQLNYMCKCMCMCRCFYAALSKTASHFISYCSCIEHEQISASKPVLCFRCMQVFALCVCVCVCTCKWREMCFCVKGGHRGAPGSAVCRLSSLRGGWRRGVRTCRPCVWEPRTPHFSYIVLLLLQTVNATKDAQPIVARDSWGGRAIGRRLAREEGSGLPLSLVWLPRLPPLLPSSLLSSHLPSAPVLSPLFSLHSALPLSPSQEDLAGPDLGGRCLSYKRFKPTQGLSFLF